MQPNQNLLDEDLLFLIHQGNISASNILFERYNFYAWRVAYDFNIEHPNSGISLEEYRQVAFSSLPRAIKSYTEFSIGFYGYWKTIALNDVVRYFKENSYLTRYEYQNTISIDDEKDSGVQLCEEVGEIDRSVSEKLFREEIRIVKDEIIASFKKEIDRLIINLYLNDYSLREIRQNVHLDYRHIQYIVKRFQKAFVQNMKKRNYN